jgi:hypothetical protein
MWFIKRNLIESLLVLVILVLAALLIFGPPH